MSRNETLIVAPVDAVFQVLADARRYSEWVVGASRIRSVDANWPEPGSSFDHKIGLWPFVLNDQTRVVRRDERSRLTLRAEIGAFGAATVDLFLEADGPGRTRVSMEERPVTGPVRWVHNPLQDRALWLRNWLSLQLLKRIVEGEAGAPRQPSGEREAGERE